MISDDELLLYHYRDGLEPADRVRIGAALSENAELAQRLHKLVARLDAAAAAIPDVPVPAAAMNRWKAALAEKADTRPGIVATRATPNRFRRYQWLAAAAVVLVALVVVFRSSPQQSPAIVGNTSTQEPAARAPNGSAYERGLKSHLASTEQQLASLETTSPEDRARLVAEIIEQNRLYALAAERAGEPQLARVLRAFSPVLENLQTEGGDTSGSVAQLAFELRVMQGRLAAATPTSANPATTL
jgi:hypothetical protein